MLAEMESSRIATAIMMIFVSLEIGFAEIVTKPSVTEVVVGGSTFLNCSTNIKQEIHWFHTPFGSKQERSIVYGYGQIYSTYVGRFNVEIIDASSAYNLVIQSVKIEDAGIYECQDETGAGKTESAQLIVLDTNPACEPHSETHEIIGLNKCGIEPNQLILSCTVRYHGNEVPILEWWNSNNKSISEEVIHGTIGSNLVVYNLTIKQNPTVKDGDTYHCYTTRSATLNTGCKSGKIVVEGRGVEYPTCDASDCKPYVNPYIYAVVFLVLLLIIAIVGTVFVLWYLRIYRPKHPKPDKKENLRDCMPCFRKSNSKTVKTPNQSLANVATTRDTGTAEEKESLRKSTSSTEHEGERAADQTREFNHHTTMQAQREYSPDITIKTLKDEVKELSERIKRRDETIVGLRQNEQSNGAEINSLKFKNYQLKALERRHYTEGNIDYLEKPVLAHTIEFSEKKKGKSEKIIEKTEEKLEKKKKWKLGKNKEKTEETIVKFMTGIAVLGNELFVVTKRSHEIQVYDSKTFQHQRIMETDEITDPMDIASSKEANWLYIVDRFMNESESKMLRLDPAGKVCQRWSTVGGNGRLSTYGSNVILCLSDKQLIEEYSSDGELIARVRLSPAAKLNNPLHAIKVSSEWFVVSHGDYKDKLRRVCVIDLDGNIKREFKNLGKSDFTQRGPETMKLPICLVEDNDGSIIVADSDNSRILLLSSVLTFKRTLIEEGNDLKYDPVRLCFDDTQNRLFVAVNRWSFSKEEWKDGRILIFNIK